jgi:methyl-accepting chemotaxis protein
MAIENKQITFKATLEPSSVQRIRDSFNSINQAAEKIAATLEKVTRAMQGFTKAQGQNKGGFGQVGVGELPQGTLKVH